MVGQGESPDESAEVDHAAGDEAAEAGRLRPVRGRPEGWYAIHGGMVAARGCPPGGSWTKLDAFALVDDLPHSVSVSTIAAC